MPGARGDSGRQWAAIAAVFMVALGLRVVLLGQHAFQMDEAAIASWSRRITQGDLLLTGGLRNDKPPLQMYLGAVGLTLFGESESSIRFMNALLSAAECALLLWALLPVAGLAAASGAGLLLACAPLHRGYGASGIMDGPLSFFLLLSFALAVRRELRWAGLAWGLAFCSKQTALFFLPLPVLAAISVAGFGRQQARDFAVGATWACGPLMLWSLLFSNPRLGAFVGMAANQPEVGFRLTGIFGRMRQWADLSGGNLPWAPALPWLLAGGLALAPLLAWRAKEAQAKAWAWAALFPVFGVTVFAALNMRHFDRYPIPYAWALCALPALAASLLPGDEGKGRLSRGLALAIGLAALVFVRWQPLSLDQQGAAGNLYDGYRALLLDAKAREAAGAILVSSQGGLRHMGAWYLDKRWTLVESPEEPSLDGRPFYAAERVGSQPPAGHVWREVASYEAFGPPPAWKLYRSVGSKR